MVQDQLVEYINSQLKAGVPADAIKTALTGAGWQAADVDDTMKHVQSPTGDSSPSPSASPSSHAAASGPSIGSVAGSGMGGGMKPEMKDVSAASSPSSASASSSSPSLSSLSEAHRSASASVSPSGTPDTSHASSLSGSNAASSHSGGPQVIHVSDLVSSSQPSSSSPSSSSPKVQNFTASGSGIGSSPTKRSSGSPSGSSPASFSASAFSGSMGSRSGSTDNGSSSSHPSAISSGKSSSGAVSGGKANPMSFSSSVSRSSSPASAAATTSSSVASSASPVKTKKSHALVTEVVLGVLMVVFGALAAFLFFENHTLAAKVSAINGQSGTVSSQLATLQKHFNASSSAFEAEIASTSAKNKALALALSFYAVPPSEAPATTTLTNALVGTVSGGGRRSYVITTPEGVKVVVNNSANTRVAALLKPLVGITGSTTKFSGTYVPGQGTITLTAVNGQSVSQPAATTTSGNASTGTGASNGLMIPATGTPAK